MFKRALAVLLIVCVQGLCFASTLAALAFKLNQTYIAASLCENRSKPKLHCKGKCYMQKMQKKADQQKEAADTVMKDIQFIVAGGNFIEPLPGCELNTEYLHQNDNSSCKGWPLRFSPPPSRLV